MTKVAEPNIIFLVNGGGSLGVSAFDQQRGLYYYAVDYNSATIFVTDVRGRVTQPPLDINVASVVEYVFFSSLNLLVKNELPVYRYTQGYFSMTRPTGCLPSHG